jgi:S-adenosylmethionine decarboxylase
MMKMGKKERIYSIVIENGLEKILKLNDKYKKFLGYDIRAEFYGVNIKYVEEIRPVVEEAIKRSGLNVIEDKTTYHQFSPEGVSVVVPLKESHMAIHTWPEKNYAWINITTCGKNSKKKAEIAYETFKKSLEPKKIKKIVLKYGV